MPRRLIKSPVRLPLPSRQVLDQAMGFQSLLRVLQELEGLKNEWQTAVDEARKATAEIKRTQRGDIGAQGPRGFSVKGDRGEQGIKGEKGDKGDKGEQGEAGMDGFMPDINSVAAEVLSRIRQPEDGKDADIHMIAGAVVDSIKKRKLLKGEHIEGWQDPEVLLNRFHARGGVRGGGDTVEAGSGVTITRSNGKATITASGSGVTFETPTGTVNGSNKTFTATATPKYIVADGVTYFENDGYTLAGLTITTTVAPTGFIRSAS